MFIKKAIHILDLNSVGNKHILINVSMIKVLMDVYSEAEIIFYCEQQHQEIAKTFFSETERKRMSFHTIATKKTNNHAFAKLLGSLTNSATDLLLLRKVLKLAGQGNELVFLLKSHALTLLLFKYLKDFYKKTPAMAILHGETEFIYFGFTKWEKQMGSLYKKILLHQSENFIYVLLNKISKDQLVKDRLLQTSEAIEITHPYPYSFTNNTDYIEKPESLTVAHVGSLGLRKNAHLLYVLAQLSKKEIDDGLINFWAIGPVEDDAQLYKNELVVDFVTKKNKGYISRQLFEETIHQIDYALFFYGRDQFIYRASGAILDVIESEKPVIVIKHPFFEYLFAEAGNIGFLCDNLNQMSDYLKQIALGDYAFIGQYKEQCENLRGFKKRNDIQSIAEDFRQQLTRIQHGSI